MVAQDARTGGVPLVRLQPVVDELPADFDTIRAEARAEGYRFLDRLAKDWASGAMRFDRPGEACSPRIRQACWLPSVALPSIRSSRMRCGCGASTCARLFVRPVLGARLPKLSSKGQEAFQW